MDGRVVNCLPISNDYLIKSVKYTKYGFILHIFNGVKSSLLLIDNISNININGKFFFVFHFFKNIVLVEYSNFEIDSYNVENNCIFIEITDENGTLNDFRYMANFPIVLNTTLFEQTFANILWNRVTGILFSISLTLKKDVSRYVNWKTINITTMIIVEFTSFTKHFGFHYVNLENIGMMILEFGKI